ncbi:MAG: MraY family glycosyltransferase [Candidatus Moraniibacteriota bacterium]
MEWFGYFILAFLFSSFLSFLLSSVAGRKSNNNFFYRLGGLAISASFVLTVLIATEVVLTEKILSILIASVLLVFFGMGDDKFNFSWKIQLVFQLLLGFLLIWFGFEIKLISFSGYEILRLDSLQWEFFGQVISVISAFFVLVWLISIMNAINWLDGTDGLLSITALLALLAIFFVSLRPEVDQPALGILALAGAGSVLGFFIFNFPPAKIIAGTSGSYFVGMLLAGLAIIAGTKIATTMIILILPVVDFVWVSLERVRKGKSIFQKEEKKTHLHYKLLNLGWSEKKILVAYFCFLGFALLVSLFVVNQFHKLFLLGLEFLMIFIFIFSLTRLNEKKDKQN